MLRPFSDKATLHEGFVVSGLPNSSKICVGASRLRGRQACRIVLWQNSRFKERVYGTPYNSRRRAPRKSAESGQETCRGRARENICQRRARTRIRRLSPLG